MSAEVADSGYAKRRLKTAQASDSFKPPKENRFVIALAMALLPWALKQRRVVRVTIDNDEWQRIEALKDSPFILSANHPTRTEPVLAGYISYKLKRPFNYISSRELFVGTMGWFLQHVGCYSITQGATDRESMAMTRKLLSAQGRKIVIFPEGEVYGHNDITLPFHSGVVQIGFWALADMVKLGKEPRLPVVPVAVKYRFVTDATAEIATRLGRLEKAVALEQGKFTWYERLLRIGERIVSNMEKQYRLCAAPDMALPERIQRIKTCIIKKVANAIGEEPPAGALAEVMRALYNSIRAYSTEFVDASSEYELKIHRGRTRECKPLFVELNRLEECVAITGHYIRDYPTFERFSEVLGRMEHEVFQKTYFQTPTEAIIRIAEPIDLEKWMVDGKAGRREAVEKATRELESRVVGLLHDLAKFGTPLPAAAGVPKAENHHALVPSLSNEGQDGTCIA